MLGDNSTLERLVVSNTDMTEVGFTAVLAALRKGNSTIMELSIGSQLLRSREVFFATGRDCLRQRDAATPMHLLGTLCNLGCIGITAIT